MKLTKNFTLSEFVESETAERKGIDNTPSQLVIDNIKIAAEGMQKIRELLDNPIFISSGYRSPKLNKAIGGSATSAHCFGYAVDFKCPNFGAPYEVTKKIIDSGLKFDQVIEEGGNSGWIHISFDPRLRQEKLSAKFVNGRAIYTEFK